MQVTGNLSHQANRLRALGFWFFQFVCLVVLTVRAFPLLVFPSVSMDEGFYIGAARAILQGDVLLTTYSFDKRFLQPFLLIPGLLLTGENAVSYHLPGLVATWIAFVLFCHLIRVVVQKTTGLNTDSVVMRLAASLLSLAVLTHPLFLSHEISAMCEPFMLAFLFYAALQVFRSEPWERPWLLAFLVKVTAVMWLPLFFLAEYFHRPSSLKEYFRLFWTRTKWLWAFLFVYVLFNREKSLPLTWYLQNSQDKPNLFKRIDFWFEALSRNFGIWHWMLWALVVGCIVGLLRQPNRSSQRKWLLILQLSTLVHLVSLPLSGAPFYDRYLILLFPQLLLASVAGAFYLAHRLLASQRLGIVQNLFAVLAVVFCISSVRSVALPLEPDAGFGRTLEAMRDLVPSGAIIHSNHVWETRPYIGKNVGFYPCSTLNCLWSERQQPISTGQFAFSQTPHLEFLHAPLLIDRKDRARCYSVKRTYATAPLKRSLTVALTDRIRLKGGEIEIHISKTDLAPLAMKEEGELTFLEPVDALHGLPVKATIRIKQAELELEGQLVLVDPFSRSVGTADPGVALYVTNVKSLRPYELNLTDVLAVVWKGRVLFLTRIDWPGMGADRLLRLRSIDAKMHTVNFEINQLEVDKNCFKTENHSVASENQ
jgi:hypothetical protein